MRRSGFLALGLVLVLFTGQQATAAVVGFTGTFLNQTLGIGGGAGSAFGAVPPPVPFHMSLTIADGAGPMGAITGGTFFLGGAPSGIIVNGGSVTLTDGGANDTAEFVVNVANGGGADNGQINYTFTGGDFFSGTAVNQAAFDDVLVRDKVSTGLNYIDFGNAQLSNYTGTITAVPEPTSMAVMLGLVAGVAGLRRRRRA